MAFSPLMTDEFPEVVLCIQVLQRRCNTTDWVACNYHIFLMVPEAGKSKFKALVDLVPGEKLLPGSKMAVFLMCLHMQKVQGSSLGSLL